MVCSAKTAELSGSNRVDSSLDGRFAERPMLQQLLNPLTLTDLEPSTLHFIDSHSNLIDIEPA